MSVLERIESTQLEVYEEVQGFDRTELRGKLKKALVDRLGLSTIASMLNSEDPNRARQEIEVVLQALLNAHEFSECPTSERSALVREVLDEVCGLGPIQSLLEDESISEVMINGCNSLFFERDGELYPSDHVFGSDEQILTVVDRILAPLGRRVDERNPIVDARLANGDRVNAVIPPVAVDGPLVTIRKFAHKTISLSDLVQAGSIPGWYARLLVWAVRSHEDIAVVGGTGSGKTTLLNALSCEISHKERIVTIEDSAELRFETHPQVVRLESRSASIEGIGEVTIRDLVRNALRMRPDRIIVGEVRSSEAIDLLQAVNTGHSGSLTTLHAGSAEEAIMRLVMMARFGMDLPTDIIEEQIATGLDLIVMSHRLSGGRRAIGSLSEVHRSSSGGVELRELVRFNTAVMSWQLLCPPRFLNSAIEEGVVSSEEVSAWQQALL